MDVTVRFAPSPTGRLHAGNIRTALFNYLFARKTGGSLVLRLDDTDTERSTEEFARGIEDDLHWLGIEWAKLVRQSDRFALYAAAVEKLKASGRLYAAYETPEELELKRKRQLARGKPPVYDRAALKLTDEEKAKFEAGGRKPHWRFKLESHDVVWDDLFKEPSRAVLAEQDVRGVQVPDSNFLRDPDLATPRLMSAIWQRVRGASTGGSQCSPRGTGLVSLKALPSGTELSTQTLNTVEASENLGFAVTIENTGCSQEVRVPVLRRGCGFARTMQIPFTKGGRIEAEGQRRHRHGQEAGVQTPIFQVRPQRRLDRVGSMESRVRLRHSLLRRY